MEINRISEIEAESNPSLAEIRFDCLVTMFEMGFKKNTISSSIKRNPPQWFKSQAKISLESIKHLPNYELGQLLKNMLIQLEAHIEKYRNYNG